MSSPDSAARSCPLNPNPQALDRFRVSTAPDELQVDALVWGGAVSLHPLEPQPLAARRSCCLRYNPAKESFPTELQSSMR